jgi:ABC-type transport system involved in multi-copper enzyme maturation permease subunit
MSSLRRVGLIAREDLRRAVRDRLLVGMFGLLALMSFPSYTGLGSVYTFEEAILRIPFDFMKFAVLPAVAAGYAAVAGDRESGALRYLLGVGATRREVLLGALASRAVVVAVPLAALLAVLGGLFVSAYGLGVLPVYAAVALLVAGYGVAWTAVAVGLSAATGSRYRALAASFLLFITFSPTLGLWRVAIRPAIAFVFTGSPSTLVYAEYADVGAAATPAWMTYTEQLNPLAAFFTAGEYLAATLAGVGSGPAAVPTAFGVGVVVALGAVPLVVGTRRFERADLGGGTGDGLVDRLRARLPRVTGKDWPPAGVRALADRLPDTPAATVFRRDLRTALGNRLLWGVVVVFLIVLVPQTWSGLDPTDVSEPLLDISRTTGRSFGLLVTVLATAASYRALAGEREAGTVRFLLGLPATRRDLVVGKLLARCVAVAAVLTPFLLVTVVAVRIRLGPSYVPAGVASVAWVLAYALAWTGMVVGWSAATASRYRTLVGVFGTFLVFSGVVDLWDLFVLPLAALAFTGSFERPRRGNAWSDVVPEWTLYVERLNPLASFGATDEWFHALLGYPTGATDPGLGLFGVAVLTAFGAVPVLLGGRRFREADL